MKRILLGAPDVVDNKHWLLPVLLRCSSCVRNQASCCYDSERVVGCPRWSVLAVGGCVSITSKSVRWLLVLGLLALLASTGNCDNGAGGARGGGAVYTRVR